MNDRDERTELVATLVNRTLEYANELLRAFVEAVDRVDAFERTHGDGPFYSDADAAELRRLNDAKQRARRHLSRRTIVPTTEDPS